MTDPQPASVVTLRLTIPDPVAGVHYSLQDQKNAPIDICMSGGGSLSFDVPITLHPDGRMTGPFVRREGPTRRFVYIAIGGQASGGGEVWSRRAKIDIHDIPAELITRARSGAVLEAILPGRAKDGGPACATVRPLRPWAVAS